MISFGSRPSKVRIVFCIDSFFVNVIQEKELPAPFDWKPNELNINAMFPDISHKLSFSTIAVKIDLAVSLNPSNDLTSSPLYE